MAATTGEEISLAVAPRGGSSHLNKPARQLVPAFLQKLYEMVNDPADQDLIRWSDAGDSFFVLDQERFASEVLGRWFKHKNFSSFVRQLNMYGFHKIPHLQQGVLRADSTTEFWNFEHPHFLRGQPDLLCLIQRKRQAPATGGAGGIGVVVGGGGGGGGVALGSGGVGGDNDAHSATVPTAVRDASGPNVAMGATLSSNKLLDVDSIVNGLQVIKRHQAAISSDLNELKNSNQHLWQEAMVARERHKKHQDTINRILKFLAGVFGHGDNPTRKDDAPISVVTRKPQRLMIADGRSEEGMGMNGVVESEVESRSSMESAGSANSTDFFGPLDMPSGQHPEPFTATRFASVEPSVSDAPTPGTADSRSVPPEVRPEMITPPSNVTSETTGPKTTTAVTSMPSQANNDHIVQTALTSVLNSPSQMQKLLAALASQSISPDVLPPGALHQHLIAPTPHNPQPYPPTFGPTASGNGHPGGASSPARLPASFDYSASGALSPFTLSLLGVPSDPDQFALQEQDDRLQKTYKSTAEINSDVDELQSNIQSLIQSLGMDPATLDTAALPPDSSAGGGNVSSVPPLTGGVGDVDMFAPPVHVGGGGVTATAPAAPVGSQDFDFDAFLMDMPRASEDEGDLDRLAEQLDPSSVVGVGGRGMASNGRVGGIGNASPEQLHAFLDEAGSVIGAGPGATADTGPRGRKRKSDMISDGTHPYASLEVPTTTTGMTTAAPLPLSTSNSNKSRRKR